jgi:hypothetical protein
MRIQDLYVGAIPRFIRNIPIRCRLSGQGLKHTCERTVRRALTPAQGLERGRDGEGVKVMTVTRA